MEENVNRDKLMARVKKMMAIANDERANEGERDTAMRQVYTILAKYNLSLGEIEQGVEEEAREEQVGESHGGPWVRTVCHAIAELMFCKYFYTRRASKIRHHFIGRVSNSTTAREMALYVYRSIEREAQRMYPNDGPARTSFAKGAAVRVHMRCVNLRREEEARTAAETTAPQATATGTALVLASLYRTEADANDEYLRNQGVKLRETADRQKRTVNGSAYHAGQAYGNAVSLHRQVGGTGKAAPRLR